ncbi:MULTISPECIES: GntR family transcriptional regulator [Halomonadaceae]|uniref:GntR family transcriptional regulator n=1 Tax=Halomonadaceae TaxID=28256 RepID=UPI001598D781|nr:MULTISPECIES: GntR family transcriptional regulator [Halomonas]QJQ96593.1 GntR family transcriptional regulator [Halomonas sp. PA5]
MRNEPFAGIQQYNLVAQVTDYLTESIIARRFQPGERLSEVQISRDLGISRAPVREAARLLESRGLLISRPRRGFFVRKLDSTDLVDVFDLRLCLERHAFQLLIGHFTPAMHDALSRQVEMMCEVAQENDDSLKIEEDLNFHRMVIEFAGNQRLLKVFEELSHELRLCIALIGRTHQDPDTIATCHWALVEALASGDARQCREAVDFHIGVARDFVVKGISEKEGGHA